MSGWIKLHRKIKKWEWYSDTNTFRVFVHLLISANHKSNRWMGNIITRGQLVTGYYALSDETGLTLSQLRTAISKLKLTNEIAVKTNNKFSIITVLKYDDYQGHDSQDDKLIADQSQTDDKPIATNKNDNNGKNEKNNIIKPEDVSDQVWTDFLSHRKAKKAPITETAIKGIRKESDKAGIGLQEALEITMARGWQSFKSEWLTKGDNYGSGQNSNREIIIGTGDIAGKPKGDGYGGRKSQTELYAEATDRIIAKRNAEWAEKEFAERIKGPPKPVIEAPTTDLFPTEEIR